MTVRTVKALIVALLGLTVLGLPLVGSPMPVAALPAPMDLEMVPGGGVLNLRDAEEPAELAAPLTLTGDVDDVTGLIDGATFTSTPSEFQFDITTPLAATVYIDATFREIVPGSVTGSVTRVPGSDNLGNVSLDMLVEVELNVEVGSPPIIPAATCVASPIALQLTSTVPYDETEKTVTLSDADFTVPPVAITSGCFDTIANGVNERLAGAGHSITLQMSGDLSVPEAGATPSATDLSVEPSPSEAGDEVTLTATVASDAGDVTAVPTGSVEFFDGEKAIGSDSLDGFGVATISTSALDVGLHSLTALYKGDPTYARSESLAVEHLVAAEPTIEASLASAIVIGGLSRTMTVTVQNPEQFGSDVENARLDLSVARSASNQNAAVLNPERFIVEVFDGDAWIPVSMTADGTTGITGAIGEATGFPLPAGATDQVRLRFTVPVVGTPGPTCNNNEPTCPGPLAVTATLLEVDPGTGEVTEPISEVVKAVNMVESSRRVTTFSFTNNGPRPHTVRQGYTIQGTGNVNPSLGGLRATGVAEFYIDGELTPVRRNDAPFGEASYVTQLPLIVGNINGFALLPPDIEVGLHFLTVRYLGDPFFAPFDTTASFHVLPKVGDPLVCRELGSTTLVEVGANLDMPVEIPAVASSGGLVELDLDAVKLLMMRPFAFGNSAPWISFANNSTHLNGGPRLHDISFEFGPNGSGTAVSLLRQGGTTIPTSPVPATEANVDQTITLEDANGSVTVSGEPGDIVPVTLTAITLDYQLSDSSALPYKMTCTPRDGALKLGEVEIAGARVWATPTQARERTDQVTIEAETFPADADGTVTFTSDVDGELGTEAVEAGEASLATDELSVGTHQITAAFDANDDEIPDTTSEPVTVEVTYSPRSGTQAFVIAARQDFTGEAAEDDVIADAVALGGGQKKSTYLTTLSRTDPYLTHVVNEMYLDTLGREGDQAGIDYWIGKLRDGTPVAKVAANFYGSPEYHSRAGGTDVAWIDTLYQDLLGRAADGPGRAYWISQVPIRTRGGVAHAFFQTPESGAFRVTDLYEFLLDRAPSPNDIAYWTPIVLRRGDLVLAVFLASSDEYAYRAEDRYPVVS